MPIPEVHVEKTLIGTIEADAPLGQCQKTVVVAHVWRQDQEAAIEAIWPANVGYCCKERLLIKKLVGGPQSDHVGVDIYDLPKLSLPPQCYLGECSSKVGAVHKVEIGRGLIGNLVDRDDMIIDCLSRVLLVDVGQELGDHSYLQFIDGGELESVHSDKHGQLLSRSPGT